jgi:glycerol-3-phosphate cytidylyltransferase
MTENKKRIVITYGTFDMFHIGHLNLLKRAKALGDYLIVGVSTDKFNEQKGKKTLIPFEQRAEIVKSIKYVDLVIPEESWEQKVRDIQKYNVDTFIIGEDWKGKFDYLKEYCEVHYLPRTKGISTTQLKRSLSTFLSIPKDELLKAFDILEQLRKDLE